MLMFETRSVDQWKDIEMLGTSSFMNIDVMENLLLDVQSYEILWRW